MNACMYVCMHECTYGCMNYACICVSIYVCMFVRTYVRTHVCMYRSISVSIYLFIYLPIYLSTYLPIYLSIYLCIYESMYPCIHVSMYLCIYGCMHACMQCMCVCKHASIYANMCVAFSGCWLGCTNILHGSFNSFGLAALVSANCQFRLDLTFDATGLSKIQKFPAWAQSPGISCQPTLELSSD